MRILFIGVHFPRPNNPTIGTWALSQTIALRDAGHEIKVVSPVAAIPVFVTTLLRRGTSAVCPPRHEWNGIKVEYVRWPLYPVGPLAKLLRDRPGWFLRIAWSLSFNRFLSIAKQYAPDVIFAHHGQLSGFIAAKAAAALRVPFFITEHNFGDIESCAVNSRRKRHYDRILENVSRWIAVANRMRNTMNEIFPDIPAVTVHNGAELIPEELKSVPRPPALADRLVVLCVTFLYKRKNVPLLVRSFDKIAAKYPSALLVLIGDGEDRQAVAAAIEQSAHRAQILPLGGLPHREVLQYMVWCDIFANIGIDEPFGVVFSEAMMAGKPIIYSADCGVTDVVVDGSHGLSVDPGDQRSASAALDRLLGDNTFREQMGASAAVLAKTQLTWANNARNMISIFRSAL